MRLSNFTFVFFTLCVGVLIGVVMDKDWITEQQMMYVEQLQTENAILKSEREGWLTYVAEEIRSTPLYVPSEDEAYNKLAFLLEEIDAEVKLVEMGVEPILEADGILISLGNEWYKEYEGPQMTLEAIPIHDIDIQNFYLSLLRLKGEYKPHEYSS